MALFIKDLALGNPLQQEEDAYDEFIRKWREKRREKRASNPKVIARRKRRKPNNTKPRIRLFNRTLKRAPKIGTKIAARKTTPTDRPIVRRTFPKAENAPIRTTKVIKATKTAVPPSSKKTSPVIQTTMIPLTRAEAQVHKNVNKAIQEEHKTKQEELKTKNLENQVEQEVAKTEQIKGQTQMASTGKGLLWVVGILGAVLVVKFVFGDTNTSQNTSDNSTMSN